VGSSLYDGLPSGLERSFGPHILQQRLIGLPSLDLRLSSLCGEPRIGGYRNNGSGQDKPSDLECVDLLPYEGYRTHLTSVFLFRKAAFSGFHRPNACQT
jgi:hypothetical protein